MATDDFVGRTPAPRTPAKRSGIFRFVGRLTVFDWIALVIAGLFSIPVLTVAGNLFRETENNTWSHLASTVLPDYIANTLWLVVGVGLGTGIIGVATAWLVSMCRFPGRRVFEWALVLPLAVPAYVMAYAYTDFLQFVGRCKPCGRSLAGNTAINGSSDPSLGGVTTMMIFVLYPYVYLLARAAFLEQSICKAEASWTLGHSRKSFKVAFTARPAAIAGVSWPRWRHWPTSAPSPISGYIPSPPGSIGHGSRSEIRLRQRSSPLPYLALSWY